MKKEDFFKIVPASTRLTPSLNAFLVLEEAEKRGIKAEYIEGTDFFILSQGENSRTLRVDDNMLGISAHTAAILTDKHQTKEFLKRSNIEVPNGVLLRRGEVENLVSAKLNKPLVIKPAASTYGGEGVVTGLRDENELKSTINSLFESGYDSLVAEEQFLEGEEFRVFATKDKVVAATKRDPANVIGDGEHSIEELIKIKNSDPDRGEKNYQTPLRKIKIDEALKVKLGEEGTKINSIPDAGQKIYLRDNSNLSTGGDSHDCTDKLHQSVKDIAVRAVNSIPDLPYAAIDFISKDITKHQEKGMYVIIEMNSFPMISMHHFPYRGEKRNVAAAIVDAVFPETKV